MSKLFTLKQWVTLADAAKYLSVSFGEHVTEADVIQLALDGHLRLSIRLLASYLYARRWYKKPASEIEYEEVEYQLNEGASTGQSVFTRREPVDGEVIHLPEFCGEGEMLQLGMSAIGYARDQPGREIADLPATRYSRVFLLQCLDEFSRPSESAQYDTGRLLIQEDSGDLWQIESYDDCLTEDIELAVRTTALRGLEQSLTSAPKAKEDDQLSTREKNTLLKIIAGLTAANYKSYTGEKRTATVAELLRDFQTVGIDDVKEDTIRKRLQEAAEYLPKKAEKS
ncbi:MULTISPECIES: hypothetical protein [Achromobacter]|uniref:Uncharacterized protein n=1 Tax=Achromobacter agilis TaxID=1353888 RepID=A0A446CKP4_9BURK|nr:MULTISPECIES: hypothetical protein [Achromobacter]KGD95262.1 hypothetical protein JL37_11280 [Achromobacter sp. RTa]SSW68494.1 hypothetical protein AGI3411_03684 [Achromobacter agilis]